MAWVDTYLKGDPSQPYQYRGLDVYAARCAVLHAFSVEAELHRKDPGVRLVGYHDGGHHESHPHLVLIGIASFVNDIVGAIALGVLFWVVFVSWIAWDFYRGIRAWWRQREQAAITQHRMVLIRLNHLEERVKRLGRAMQDPDTLADDADDAEALDDEAPVDSGGHDALGRERRWRAVPAALQALEHVEMIKARLWLVRWPGLVCLIGLGAAVVLNQFHPLPDWLYLAGVILTWGGVVSGLLAMWIVALKSARRRGRGHE